MRAARVVYHLHSNGVLILGLRLQVWHASHDDRFFQPQVVIRHVKLHRQLVIQPNQIVECIGDYGITDHATLTQLTTMGVDVGRVCHVWIDEWKFLAGMPNSDDYNENAIPKTIWFGTCDFPQLDKLMFNFKIRSCVIDALPETRMSEKFAAKFPGYVQCCHYNYNVKAKTITKRADGKDSFIVVNRTNWMDMALGRFKDRTIVLPKDLNREAREHLNSPVKVPKRDSNGEATYIYESSTADHYAHARVYSEIALPLAMGIGPSTNTSKV